MLNKIILIKKLSLTAKKKEIYVFFDTTHTFSIPQLLCFLSAPGPLENLTFKSTFSCEIYIITRNIDLARVVGVRADLRCF